MWLNSFDTHKAFKFTMHKAHVYICGLMTAERASDCASNFSWPDFFALLLIPLKTALNNTQTHIIKQSIFTICENSLTKRANDRSIRNVTLCSEFQNPHI